jgi:hypothetical protein
MTYQPYQPQQPPPPKKRRTWLIVLLSAAGAFIVLVGGFLAAIGGAVSEVSDSIETPAPVATSVPVEEPTVEVTEDPGAEAAEETTQPPAKPIAKKWVKLVTLNGSADKSSKVITTKGGDLRLTYNFRGGDSLVIGGVYLLDKGTDLMKDGGIPEVMVTEPSKDSTLLYRDAGQYFVKVTAANTRYTVTVEELR